MMLISRLIFVLINCPCSKCLACFGFARSPPVIADVVCCFNLNKILR